MIHYHGTPITPRSVLHELTGRNFCVSFAAPNDLSTVLKIGQSVMFDNGAFSLWRAGTKRPDWQPFVDWVRPLLEYQCHWAVLPDVIDGDEDDNDALLQWWDDKMGNHHFNVAPVWHLHEDTDRLKELIATGYTRVCFGSSGEYARVGSDSWHRRVTEAFNEIVRHYGNVPVALHMLRGMSLAGSQYPFASVDSTDIARNHNRKNNARQMAESWDAQNNPGAWAVQPEQVELQEAAQ